MSRFGADVLARARAFVGRDPSASPVGDQGAGSLSGVDVAEIEAPGPDSVALAAILCREFEGLYLRAYLCPAGVWTIGYGATRYENGRPVMPTDPQITRERAEHLLRHDITTIRLPAVRRLCPGAVRAGREAALIDFAFNLGTGALEMSTLRQRVNAGRWDAVPHELRRWVIGGGKVLPGLVRRREAEIRLL